MWGLVDLSSTFDDHKKMLTSLDPPFITPSRKRNEKLRNLQSDCPRDILLEGQWRYCDVTWWNVLHEKARYRHKPPFYYLHKHINLAVVVTTPILREDF